MATKPTLADARWATDESNNTAPSGGQRDTGWTANQVAVSDYFNVLGLEAYRWFTYLDDGYLTGRFGLASQISPSAIGGTVADYAPTDVATAFLVKLDLSSDTILNSLAGGATGRMVVLMNVDATHSLTIAHETGGTAANRFNCGGYDLILDAQGSAGLFTYDDTSDRWRLLSHTGRLNKPQTIIIPGFDGSNGPLGTWAGYESSDVHAIVHGDADTSTWRMALHLPVGARVQTITARVFGHTTKTLTMQTWAAVDGAAAAQGGSDTSATSAAYDTLSVTPDFVVATGGHYYVVFTPTAVSAAVRVHKLEVTIDFPAG